MFKLKFNDELNTGGIVIEWWEDFESFDVFSGLKVPYRETCNAPLSASFESLVSEISKAGIDPEYCSFTFYYRTKNGKYIRARIYRADEIMEV